MTETVALREVGMRDGLQSLAPILTTEQKNAWCAAEFAAGVREIEVTSFVPAKLLPMFADAEDVVRHALSLPGLKVSALIPNLRGAERGVALGVHEVAHVLSVSEGHNQNNVRRSTQDSIDDLTRVIELRDSLEPGRRIKVIAGLATVFGCTIEGNVDEKRVLEIAGKVLAVKPDALMLADTVGYGNPAAIRRVFREVLDMAGSIPVAAHFHNTRGLGLANVLAALEVGVRSFDASLGGLGGCPWAPGATGNIVMEDTAFMMEAMGFDTGIDLDRLIEVRRMVEGFMPGITFHGDLPKAGIPKNYARRLAA
ncbi:MAG TPA: hydroxymethylglutaryl-CoA lyase [Beijerinckiaceae bacterium]|nr:hydroxymethylglutaryl-CoA lyase [Beijerinckiaceae bacterium]